MPLTISEKNVKSVFYVLATTFSAQRICPKHLDPQRSTDLGKLIAHHSNPHHSYLITGVHHTPIISFSPHPSIRTFIPTHTPCIPCYAPMHPHLCTHPILNASQCFTHFINMHPPSKPEFITAFKHTLISLPRIRIGPLAHGVDSTCMSIVHTSVISLRRRTVDRTAAAAGVLRGVSVGVLHTHAYEHIYVKDGNG